MKQTPINLLYSDDDGVILEHPELLAAGDCGGDPCALRELETMELPRGSDLFMLPGRSPIGFDPETNQPIVLDCDDTGRPVHAVAAFLAPAHTTISLTPFETRSEAPALPLYSYAAVGFAGETYRVAGRRVDPSVRQDPWRFNEKAIRRGVDTELEGDPNNRLLLQLKRCALEYQCRAAQNFFLHRHEAPLPTSIACNAGCLGCISLQPDGTFKAAHDRLQIAPKPEEVAAVALKHIGRVPDGVVSFGQGCEGEPLMMSELLPAVVRLVRRETEDGTINLNTNGSLPEVVARLVDAGLDSMRISLNSAIPEVYQYYYNPRGYSLASVRESMSLMTAAGRFVSLNLLYFPGVTDRAGEIEALSELIDATGVGMIQLRNLNIDPEIYRKMLPSGTGGDGMGLGRFQSELTKRFPGLHYGYFNPPREEYRSW
jgi:pyruvate-formate lyase-activating enzyme